MPNTMQQAVIRAAVFDACKHGHAEPHAERAAEIITQVIASRTGRLHVDIQDYRSPTDEEVTRVSRQLALQPDDDERVVHASIYMVGYIKELLED